MLHPELKEFLLAIVGASASFIGLLFVAISFVMNDEADTEKSLITKRILAESSYTALLNVFFVGLVALIPATNIGYVTVIMSWLGLSNAIHFIRVTRKAGNPMLGWALLGFSVLLYSVEMFLGIYIALQNHSTYYLNNYTYMTIVLLMFSIALARAWELTGIRESKTKR